MKVPDLYEIYKNHPVISTDTRQNIKGSIFFAIKGENFDANQFALDAIDKGAAYAVVDDPKLDNHEKIIFTPNSLETLQELAIHHRKQLNIPIIAITGSNGKTTTKELCGKVLNMKYNTFTTPGNLNNHIGLPLCLLKINGSHQIAVLEIGANHQGENAFLTNICLPDYGITTNIGKDHLGEFGGIEGVIASYKEFIDYFNLYQDYHFFLNTDDPFIKGLVKTPNIIPYGTIFFDHFLDLYCFGDPERGSFPLKANISYSKKNFFIKFNIKSNFFGRFNLSNIVAATTIGLHFDVAVNDIITAIESFIPENYRSQILKKGSNTVILDAYNANPSSMELVIKEFDELSFNNKIIILGDMLELGEYSSIEHLHIIEKLERSRFSQIILVGEEFGKFKTTIPCRHFSNSDQLKNWLETQHYENTIFMVKGSRGMKLEKAFTG